MVHAQVESRTPPFVAMDDIDLVPPRKLHKSVPEDSEKGGEGAKDGLGPTRSIFISRYGNNNRTKDAAPRSAHRTTANVDLTSTKRSNGVKSVE